MNLYKSEVVQLHKFRAAMKILDLQAGELNHDSNIHQFFAQDKFRNKQTLVQDVSQTDMLSWMRNILREFQLHAWMSIWYSFTSNVDRVIEQVANGKKY